jgi:putative heme iron utilization protein
MRVLDHSSAANPWHTASTTEVEDSIKHEPTDAERARTVLGNNRSAVLSVAIGESPLGFAVPYAVDEIGVPIVGIRNGIERSLRLNTEVHVCLAVAETPLTATHSGAPGGVSVLATAHPIGGPQELSHALATFVRTQPAETSAVKRGYSKLFRLTPTVILVAGGSGEISRVDIDEYTASSSDPLAAVAPGLVAHLANDEHGSLVLLCRAYGGLHKTKSAELVAIDQYGMDLFATTDSGREAVRIPFSHAVSSPDDVRRELTAMARGARFKLGAG